MNFAKLPRGSILVMLMVFVVVATTVIGAAVTVSIISTQSTYKSTEGAIAIISAEGVIESGLIRTLRKNTFTSTLVTLGGHSVTLTSDGTGPYTLTATTSGFSTGKTIVATGTFSSNLFSYSGWSDQ